MKSQAKVNRTFCSQVPNACSWRPFYCFRPCPPLPGQHESSAVFHADSSPRYSHCHFFQQEDTAKPCFCSSTRSGAQLRHTGDEQRLSPGPPASPDIPIIWHQEPPYRYRSLHGPSCGGSDLQRPRTKTFCKFWIESRICLHRKRQCHVQTKMYAASTESRRATDGPPAAIARASEGPVRRALAAPSRARLSPLPVNPAPPDEAPG